VCFDSRDLVVDTLSHLFQGLDHVLFELETLLQECNEIVKRNSVVLD